MNRHLAHYPYKQGSVLDWGKSKLHVLQTQVLRTASVSKGEGGKLS